MQTVVSTAHVAVTRHWQCWCCQCRKKAASARAVAIGSPVTEAVVVVAASMPVTVVVAAAAHFCLHEPLNAKASLRYVFPSKEKKIGKE